MATQLARRGTPSQRTRHDCAGLMHGDMGATWFRGEIHSAGSPDTFAMIRQQHSNVNQPCRKAGG